MFNLAELWINTAIPLLLKKQVPIKKYSITFFEKHTV